MIKLKGWNFASPQPVGSPDECEWYHSMNLPEYGTQFGQWDLRERWDDYVGGIDVRDKSVFDVGTASGWISFEAERHGAAEVVAFEALDYALVQRVPHRFSSDRPEECALSLEAWKRGFWLAHRLYHSNVKALYGDVYALAEHVQDAEILIAGQVLVHLRDPLGALIQLARCATETLVIVDGSFEDDRPMAVFLGGSDGSENQDSWFHFSTGLYRNFLAILGFEITSIRSNEYNCLIEGRTVELWTFVANRFAATAAEHFP